MHQAITLSLSNSLLHVFDLYSAVLGDPLFSVFDAVCLSVSVSGLSRWGSFSGPRDVWGAPPSLKNSEKGVSDDFFDLKYA